MNWLVTSVACLGLCGLVAPAWAQAARNCPPSVKGVVGDGEFHAFVDGKWMQIGRSTNASPSPSVLFAYGVADGDENAGIVLFKSIDWSRRAAGKQPPNVQLHRDPVKQRRLFGGTRTDAGMAGSIPLMTYQDYHENAGRDEPRPLAGFHSRYIYKGRAQRRTNSPVRRKEYAHADYELTRKKGNPLLKPFTGEAVADVRLRETGGEGAERIRSTLKYYGERAKAAGGVICFSLAIHPSATRTRFEITDFDYSGNIDDGRPRALGRTLTREINWR